MRHEFKALCGAIVMVSIADVACAGVAPALTIDANLGGVMQQFSPTGNPGGAGFQYERDFNNDPVTVNVADGTIDFGWSWIADPTAGTLARGLGSPVSLVGGLTVANNTSATQTISFLTTLPLFSTILPSSVISGSTAATLTISDDGGTLSTSGSTAFYQGMIDGAVVPMNAADLIPAPTTSSPGPFQSGGFAMDSFGGPAPSQPAGEISTSIGILITFDLSAGDAMSFTSAFAADNIPTPGSIAILMVAGLVTTPRRRR